MSATAGGMNKLHIVLTSIAILVEGATLIERFAVVFGDYLQGWILPVAAAAPIIPLTYLCYRLNSRTSNGQAHSRIWRDGSSVLLGLGIVIPILIANPRVVLSANQSLLVADVDDYTVNGVFSSIGTRGLLEMALKQSPRLSIFSDDKLVDALDRMKKPRNSKVTNDIGREICTREGVGPLITWSATESNGTYNLTARILNPLNGVVFREVSTGPFALDRLQDSIGTLAKKIQKAFGDSVLQIYKTTKALTPATTRSLDALAAYSEALQDLNEYKYDAATSKLLAALQLDPDFALAMVELASLYDYRGDTQSAAGYLKKAFEQRDTLTEPERVRVSEYYHWLVENDHHKAIDELRDFLNRYPRNQDRLGTLATAYYFLMQFGDAVETNRKILGPPHWRTFAAETAVSMWNYQLSAEQISQALETAKEVAQDMPELEDDNPYMVPLTNLALGDTKAVENAISNLKSNHNDEAALWLGGTLSLYRGNLSETLIQWSQYIALIKRSDRSGTPWIVSEDRAHLWVARMAILSGNNEEARKHLDQVSNVREEELAEVGKYYARLGDAEKAREVLDKLHRRLDQRSTNQNLSLLKLLESEIELAKGNSDAAFLLASQAPDYAWSYSYWEAQETRAHVALAAGHPEIAIKSCNEMSQKRGFAFSSDRIEEWIIAHYYLGVGYEATNRPDLALSAYKEFENIWHSSEAAMVLEARKRIKRLNSL